MINQAQYQYIKEVLGITQVMVPEGFEPLSAGAASPSGLAGHGSAPVADPTVSGKVIVHENTDSPVAILTNHELNPAQKNLALKILKAVKVENPCIIEVDGMNEPTARKIQDQVKARRFVYFEEHFEKFYGTIEKVLDSQVLYTYELDLMLEGKSSEIQSFKKQVWQHMKLFSSRWEKK